jgi:hypothetical protein
LEDITSTPTFHHLYLERPKNKLFSAYEKGKRIKLTSNGRGVRFERRFDLRCPIVL